MTKGEKKERQVLAYGLDYSERHVAPGINLFNNPQNTKSNSSIHSATQHVSPTGNERFKIYI
ncbi:hypothetical protein DCAR_0103917 [Daucus carota subsp. sativus]|uniref:Uncharacterized protein n=1 Tax=Daucus carota subsp. sativus TaxID=79200 RepID=A0A166IE39_DAUCS|nr:hypothetical protein DCAR_0103917 [Daucus carota subsp. sativus]